MRFYLFVVICLFYIYTAAGQPELVVGLKINITEDSLQTYVERVLQQRLLEGMANHGVRMDYEGQFYVEVGMQSFNDSYTTTQPIRIIRSFEVYFKLLNSGTRELFNSYTTTVNATGRSDQEVALNAVLQLNLATSGFEQFLSAGKNKIFSYYQTNCHVIIAKAKSLITQRQYIGAISVLRSIPPVFAACFAEADKVMQQAVVKYQDYVCEIGLIQVKANIANQDFETALNLLMGMPFAKKCEAELKQVVNQLMASKRDQQLLEFDRFIKSQHFQQEAYKQQLSFMENIAYLLARPDYNLYFDRTLLSSN
jgi:hypothetical protein